MDYQTRALAKWLMTGGALLFTVGFLIYASRWLPFLKNIGHLPGDLVFKNGRFAIYFPVMSCIVVSVILGGILWLFRK